MGNELKKETSPYLLQHADNPVHWLAYGNEALAKAKSENKLLLISIGYAACHWCHVMEKESFEDEEVARLMNAHFVCVKVDREERPDIDKMYINAVQLLNNGNAGWPLNCFCLPDGRPIFGGTYFRKKDWMSLLERLELAYRQNPNQFDKTAEQLLLGIQQSSFLEVKEDEQVDADFVKEQLERLKYSFDTENGGLRSSIKFPMPGLYEMLLNAGIIFEDEDLLEHINLTSKKWAYGGIYDQLGGGFARYSVDRFWLVPHFEKMLYDNAQIVSLFSKLYRYTNLSVYKRLVKETLVWLQKDMCHENKLFYSSYDADTDGKEGAYYVWNIATVREQLKGESEDFIAYFSLTEKGNFEGENILFVPSMEEPNARIEAQKRCLLQLREKSPKPDLDYKHIASWNALMLTGLCDAYLAFDKADYRSWALESAEAMWTSFYHESLGLLRLAEAPRKGLAFLDDYAFFIKAFLDVYVISFDKKWLLKAEFLLKESINLFFDKSTSMFFYSSDKHDVITRSRELDDNVIPSSNAIMSENMIRLSSLLSQSKYSDMAEKMLKNMKENISQNPLYHYQWMNAYLFFSKPEEERVWVGDRAEQERQKFCKDYSTFVHLAGSTEPDEDLLITKGRYQKGKTLAYHCKDNACTCL